MTIDKIIRIGIIFLLGFVSSNFLGLLLGSGIESPLASVLGFSSILTTPQDFIKEDQIVVNDDRIIINVAGASISRYAATGSMIPILDENSNGIRIKPESEDQIQVGDIITFRQDNMMIVHRVIEKGIDSQGVYFITKGDNNDIDDGKVRFKDVQYITIGILW